MTPPTAESPYSEAPGPLNASMRRIADAGIADQSTSPDSASATCTPSTRSTTYSASPPPKKPRADTTGRPASNRGRATAKPGRNEIISLGCAAGSPASVVASSTAVAAGDQFYGGAP